MMKMKLELGMVLEYKSVPSEFDYFDPLPELLIILDITSYTWNGRYTEKFLCYHVQSCQLHTISSNTLHRYYSPLMLSTPTIKKKRKERK